MKVIIDSLGHRRAAVEQAERDMAADIAEGFIFSGDGALYPCDLAFQIGIVSGLLIGASSREVTRKDGQVVTLSRQELRNLFVELDAHLTRITAAHARKVKKYASAAILRD